MSLCWFTNNLNMICPVTLKNMGSIIPYKRARVQAKSSRLSFFCTELIQPHRYLIKLPQSVIPVRICNKFALISKDLPWLVITTSFFLITKTVSVYNNSSLICNNFFKRVLWKIFLLTLHHSVFTLFLSFCFDLSENYTTLFK